LLSFALAMALLEVAEKVQFHPLTLSLGSGTPILRFHLLWIFALLLVGAIAAYVSRRAGGSLRTSLLSGVFGMAPFAVVFLGAMPVGLIVGHPISYRLAAEAIAYGALGWVLAPAAALLAGGWLVELLRSAAHRRGNACVA
jgi:hypothetical protein